MIDKDPKKFSPTIKAAERSGLLPENMLDKLLVEKNKIGGKKSSSKSATYGKIFMIRHNVRQLVKVDVQKDRGEIISITPHA